LGLILKLPTKHSLMKQNKSPFIIKWWTKNSPSVRRKNASRRRMSPQFPLLWLHPPRAARARQISVKCHRATPATERAAARAATAAPITLARRFITTMPETAPAAITPATVLLSINASLPRPSFRHGARRSQSRLRSAPKPTNFRNFTDSFFSSIYQHEIPFDYPSHGPVCLLA